LLLAARGAGPLGAVDGGDSRVTGKEGGGDRWEVVSQRRDGTDACDQR
jgi:hypothetical protein